MARSFSCSVSRKEIRNTAGCAKGLVIEAAGCVLTCRQDGGCRAFTGGHGRGQMRLTGKVVTRPPGGEGRWVFTKEHDFREVVDPVLRRYVAELQEQRVTA